MQNKASNILSLLIVALYLIASNSCTERIDIELESTFTRLVVYGEITTDTAIHAVRLTKTTDYYYNQPAPEVSDALVSISDGSSIYLLKENPDQPGRSEERRVGEECR